jgi:D-arabinose 1-dehydrogenase-like Zn-dependent alcohol dehydrogenase
MVQEARSWRENASQQAQDDLESLFAECMDVAFQLLSKNKAFYPFALTLSKDGKFAIAGTFNGEEHPLSQDVVSELKAALTMSRNEIKAAAIVDDVKVDRRYDAVRASMEHCEGTAIEIIVPYEMSVIFKKVKLKTEESAAFPIEKYIWND